MILGNLVSIHLDLEGNPKMNLELSNLKDLTILVGQNGTGKSFVLKSVWVMTMITNGNMMSQEPKALGSYLIKNSFEDPTAITGKMIAYYTCGTETSIEIEKGECLSSHSKLGKNVNEPKPPIYMSARTRLFTEIRSFINMRKTIAGHLNQITNSNAEAVSKMLDFYKLPDFTFLEKRLYLAQMGQDIPEKISDVLVKEYDFPYTPVKIVMYEENIMVLDSKGKLNDPCVLGAGHQAVLNMMTIM